MFLVVFSSIACGQSEKVYRIGMLETTSATMNRANLEAFLRGLRDAGYVEGKNLVIDYRSADGRAERFPDLARDVVRARPDLIVTRGTTATIAVMKATSLPIVMAASADPIGPGIVANLAHPGGNVTGLTAIVSELGGKRLEIIKEVVPSAKHIGFIVNAASNPSAPGQWREIERAAHAFGLDAELFDVRDPRSLEASFAEAASRGIAAFLTTGESVTLANRAAMTTFAAKYKVPVVYTTRAFVDAGGLISYGPRFPELYYRAASYVDKILQGAKPGDLPIEQPTTFELVVNLKAAKALGITIPRDVLLQADEVLQ
jgi:putative ABC transport system substrate-binding protein